MFAPGIKDHIVAAAGKSGLDPAALLAVIEVESNGIFFALVDGRNEPLIRFEGHYFDRRLDGELREKARRDSLSSPIAGAIANPRSQSQRWALLNRACSISQNAALESTSWGVGQVMGAHWKALGYPSVAAMVDEARAGVTGQVGLLIRFIEKNGLTPLLVKQDWTAFARRYNGPGFRRNRYDSKLRSAYASHSALILETDQTPVSPPGQSVILSIGAKGESVRELQLTLTSLGYPAPPSGIFDAATRTAVKAFQSHKGLLSDGIAGAKTLSALAAATNAAPDHQWITRLMHFLARLLGLRN